MQFEWDEAKNLENIRKHEIDFANHLREQQMVINPEDVQYR